MLADWLKPVLFVVGYVVLMRWVLPASRRAYLYVWSLPDSQKPGRRRAATTASTAKVREDCQMPK